VYSVRLPHLCYIRGRGTFDRFELPQRILSDRVFLNQFQLHISCIGIFRQVFIIRIIVGRSITVHISTDDLTLEHNRFVFLTNIDVNCIAYGCVGGLTPLDHIKVVKSGDAMSKEQAYSILETIAILGGRKDRLHLYGKWSYKRSGTEQSYCTADEVFE